MVAILSRGHELISRSLQNMPLSLIVKFYIVSAFLAIYFADIMHVQVHFPKLIYYDEWKHSFIYCTRMMALRFSWKKWLE